MVRFRSRCLVGLLVALLSGAGAAIAGPIHVQGFAPGSQDPEILNAGLLPEDYGYHPDESSSWGESWSMQAGNTAGDFLLVLLSISNYHPFHKYAGTADLFYYPATGERYKGHGEFPSDRVRAEKTRVKVDVGGNVFEGAHPTYHLKASLQDLSFDLTFHVRTPALRYGQGFLRFGQKGERSWNLTILGPRAEVSGTITAAGKTVPFAGLAYLDHGWSTEKLYKFSKTWHVVRVVQDDVSLNVVRMQFRDGYEPRETQAIYITEGDRVIANSGAVRLVPAGGVRDAKSGVVLPESFELSYENGGTRLAGTVRMTRTIEALNVLDQLTPVLRKVIQALVTDPWQFRLAGEADLTLTHDGRTRKIDGLAVGEVHFYK